MNHTFGGANMKTLIVKKIFAVSFFSLFLLLGVQINFLHAGGGSSTPLSIASVAYDSRNGVFIFAGTKAENREVWVQICDSTGHSRQILTERRVSDFIRKSSDDRILRDVSQDHIDIRFPGAVLPKNFDLTNPDLSNDFSDVKIIYNRETETSLVVWVQKTPGRGQRVLGQIFRYLRNTGDEDGIIIPQLYEPRVLDQVNFSYSTVLNNNVIKNVDLHVAPHYGSAIIAITVGATHTTNRFFVVRLVPMFLTGSVYHYNLDDNLLCTSEELEITRFHTSEMLVNTSASIHKIYYRAGTDPALMFPEIRIYILNTYSDGTLELFNVDQDLSTVNDSWDYRILLYPSDWPDEYVSTMDNPIVRANYGTGEPIIVYSYYSTSSATGYRKGVRVVSPGRDLSLYGRDLIELADVNPPRTSSEFTRFHPDIVLTGPYCFLTFQGNYLEGGIPFNYIFGKNISLTPPSEDGERNISDYFLVSLGPPVLRRNIGIAYNNTDGTAHCYWEEGDSYIFSSNPVNLNTVLCRRRAYGMSFRKYLSGNTVEFSWLPYPPFYESERATRRYTLYLITNDRVIRPLIYEENTTVAAWENPTGSSQQVVAVLYVTGILNPQIARPITITVPRGPAILRNICQAQIAGK